MLKITQGFQFRYAVPDQSCIMVLKSSHTKITVSTVELVDGQYYLTATAAETSLYQPDNYVYQVISSTSIEQQGQAEIIRNLRYTDENDSISKNRAILEAIDAVLEGRATAAQASVSVDGKSISYMSVSDLLALRAFFEKKVYEEEHNGFTKNDERKIRYVWSLR